MTLTLVETSTVATPAGRSWLERLRPHAALPIHESVAEPELVEAALRRLGPDEVAWAAQVGAEAAARIYDRFPSFKNDTHLRPGTQSITLSALLSTLDRTAAVPPITHDATTNIRRCVTRGVTLDEMLNGIRQAHATMSQAFLAACDRLAPAEQRAAILRTTSAQLFDHIDRLARMASEIYESSCSPAPLRRVQSRAPQSSESSSGRVPTRHAKHTASTRCRPDPRHVDAVAENLPPHGGAVRRRFEG